MPQDYEAHKENARRRIQALTQKGRDIGSPPDVVNPQRKEESRDSFRLFCEHYYPQTFHLEWSEDHLKVISKIESAVLHGGLFGVAMPRGSGKTSLSLAACVWALVYGHRSFVALIAASEDAAKELLKDIKVELESNEQLFEDFPEVCYPLRKLEGETRRTIGQTCEGKRTLIGWTANELVLPTIEGSVASGAIVRVAGITGRVRGMKSVRQHDGANLRPDLVIVDDPQTDASARSPSQCHTRLSTLAGAILGLGGPGERIAGVMPCTVIQSGDVADRILDQQKHPEWQGERTKLLYSSPCNEKLWDQYREILQDCFRAGDPTHKKATEFYRGNREAMDAGAETAWAARFDEHEVSALQHAMNLRFIRGEGAFAAEYQNEPLEDTTASILTLTTDEIAEHQSKLARGICPLGTSRLTADIDVHGDVLFYAVCAWSDDFTGTIIDYGCYPEQNVNYFLKSNAKQVLNDVTGSSSESASILKGLEVLSDRLLSKEWLDESGTGFRIERCVVDSGYATATVYQFCRQSPHAAVLLPSKGFGITERQAPLNEYKRIPGERRGWCWRVVPAKTGHSIHYDSNAWKTYVHQSLKIDVDERGTLTLFRANPSRHQMIAEHIDSEFPTAVSGRGRDLLKWAVRPTRTDNHLLDCVVGCCVAASERGCKAVGHDVYSDRPVRKKKKRKREFNF